MRDRSTGPPEAPTFCIDESLGNKVIAGILRDAGHSVELLIDHFPRGTFDAEWLPHVGDRGWIVLTKDKKMRKRLSEQLAVVRHGVRAFTLTSGGMRAEEMGEVFLAAMPRILRLLRKHPGPFIAAVTRAGNVSIVYPEGR